MSGELRVFGGDRTDVEYDGSTGWHTVLYDDNDTEVLSLSSEKVIWKSAPTVVSDATHLIDSDTEQRSHKTASNMKVTTLNRLCFVLCLFEMTRHEMTRFGVFVRCDCLPVDAL